MKTTKVFIGLSAIISVLLFSFGFYDGGVYFIFVTACIFILNSAFNKNAKLTSKLTDAESDARYWKERFDLCNMWSKKNAERIQELSAELETAKTNSYHEVERKRCREKYDRLYKGKKKSVATEQKNEQTYQIEGKTIKQLVEENLGVIVNDAGFSELKSGEICGFSKEYAVIGINDSSGWDDNYIKFDILKKYTTYWFAQKEQLINAIKKHRNIQ